MNYMDTNFFYYSIYDRFIQRLPPKRQMSDSSKLEYYTDNNFRFDENDRKFFKWVENTVGKGEIARYEQFILFPRCFQKTCTADR